MLPEIVLNIESEYIEAKTRKLHPDWKYVVNEDGSGYLKKIKKSNIRSIDEDWEVSKIS